MEVRHCDVLFICVKTGGRIEVMYFSDLNEYRGRKRERGYLPPFGLLSSNLPSSTFQI